MLTLGCRNNAVCGLALFLTSTTPHVPSMVLCCSERRQGEARARTEEPLGLWKCAEVGKWFEMSQLLCVIRAPLAVSRCQCFFSFFLFFFFFFYERLVLPMLFSSVLKSTGVKYFARAAYRHAPTPCLA
jgi:hypothetical protein